MLTFFIISHLTHYENEVVNFYLPTTYLVSSVIPFH